MNTVKVYDRNGKHVDSFKKPVKKGDWSCARYSRSYSSMIRQINRVGYCVKRQLADLKRTQLGAL